MAVVDAPVAVFSFGFIIRIRPLVRHPIVEQVQNNAGRRDGVADNMVIYADRRNGRHHSRKEG